MTYTWCCMCSLDSWWWMERPSKTCRVIFNKHEKIVHLVGFAIEIYHDARSHEHQIYHHIKGNFKYQLVVRFWFSVSSISIDKM